MLWHRADLTQSLRRWRSYSAAAQAASEAEFSVRAKPGGAVRLDVRKLTPEQLNGLYSTYSREVSSLRASERMSGKKASDTPPQQLKQRQELERDLAIIEKQQAKLQRRGVK